jgi:hypothetical protein
MTGVHVFIAKRGFPPPAPQKRETKGAAPASLHVESCWWNQLPESNAVLSNRGFLQGLASAFSWNFGLLSFYFLACY